MVRSRACRRCSEFGRGRFAALAAILAAIAILAGHGPGYAGEKRGSDISRLLSVPHAIPGTEAYHLEQAGQEISTFVTDLDAVEGARVALRQRDDGRLGALITLHLSSQSVWDRPLCDAVVGIVTTCAPSVTLKALKVIDQRGRVLYSSGSANIADGSSSTTAGSSGGYRINAAFIVLAGVFLGFIAAGAWWLVGRAPSPDTSEQGDEGWAFLKNADPEAVADAFAGLRPEMVGAVIAGLDESTRSSVLGCLPARSTPDLSPTDQMHPEVDARLRQLLRDRMPP